MNLIDAVKGGDPANVRVILAKNIGSHYSPEDDPNARDDQGISALLWTIKEGNDRITDTLIDHGTKLNY